MDMLTLETFISADTDVEKNQYRILGGLKEYKNEFNHKRIYPALDNLIRLCSTLEDIIRQKNILNISLPKPLRNFELFKSRPVYANIYPKVSYNDLVISLISWSLPLIRDVIEEGIVLYEFVEKNIFVEHIGGKHVNKEHGYFFISDIKEDIIQIHKFEFALYSSGSMPFKSLKTKYIQSAQKFIFQSPELMQRYIKDHYGELPDPVAFKCITDLDFPMAETIFPIAKRKLLALVTAD